MGCEVTDKILLIMESWFEWTCSCWELHCNFHYEGPCMYFKFIWLFLPYFSLLIFYFSLSSTLKIPEEFSEPSEIDAEAGTTKETSKALFN